MSKCLEMTSNSKCQCFWRKRTKMKTMCTLSLCNFTYFFESLYFTKNETFFFVHRADFTDILKSWIFTQINEIFFPAPWFHRFFKKKLQKGTYFFQIFPVKLPPTFGISIIFAFNSSILFWRSVPVFRRALSAFSRLLLFFHVYICRHRRRWCAISDQSQRDFISIRLV